MKKLHQESGNDERTFYVETLVALNLHLFHATPAQCVIPYAIFRMFGVHLLFELLSQLLEILFRDKTFKDTVLNTSTEV